MRKSRSESESEENRIVVVEESADTIYSMRFILQSLGYSVTAVAARRGFLEELRKSSPKAVLVDMLIPSGRGFSAIREIRKSDLKDIKILAVTADAVPFSEEEIHEAGADDIIVKPYTVSQIQEKLDQYL